MTQKTIPNDIFFKSVEELVAEGQSVEIRVKGFSMRPFLRDGRDTVRLTGITAEELRCGMVVLFRNRGRHTLHRLKSIDGERLCCEGDGNYRQTESVATSDVVAVVDSVERGRRQFAYGSAEWNRLSRRSLLVKALRTFAIDIKRKLKI